MYLSTERLPGYYYCGKSEYKIDEVYSQAESTGSVIFFVMSGVLRFNENGYPIEIHAGEYHIHREGLSIDGDLNCDIPVFYYIEFPGDFKTSTGIPIDGPFDIQLLTPVIDELCESEKNSAVSFFKRVSLFLDILDKLFINTQAEHVNRLGHRVAKYIHRKFKSNISIVDIEREFSYSSSYIINAFKEEFGLTPYQYIKRLRLDASKHMMLHTSMSIEQIAFDCGYTNFTTYYRNFTETFGKSPSAWRNEAKNKMQS